MDIQQLIEIDSYQALILAIDLAVAMVLLVGIKFISGVISGVNATDELAEKDNPAFGISVAGVGFGVTIMLTGVMAGEASADLVSELVLVAGYGALGIVLMSVTRFIFDRISMPGFSVSASIKEGNIAAAILDAGNVIATAIIIRSIMVWLDADTFVGVAMVIGGYLISQLILSIASLYRLKLFSKRHGKSMQEAFEGGNVAAAWRFTGFRIGVALAITATSGLVPYKSEGLAVVAITWIVVALSMMAVLSILSFVMEKVVLAKIDTRDEVDVQANIAIGVIQCAFTVGVGILLAALAN